MASATPWRWTLPTQMAMSVSGAVYGNYSYRYDQNFLISWLHREEVTLEYDADRLLTKYGGFEIKHEGRPRDQRISDNTLTSLYL